MSLIAEFRIHRPITYFTLLLTLFATVVSHGDSIGSTSDLWDVNNGTIVTATSGIRLGFDATDMFGGESSSRVPGETIFDDDRPPGFVHYIEWQTAAPVRIGQIDLYARGDSPLYLNEREFDRFVLRARSEGSPTYDQVILDITPSHPFELLDETSGLFLRTNVLAFVSQDFRAEFTQFNAGRGYDGPRIMELDAFEPVSIAPSDSDLWDISNGASVVQTSGMWGGFDATDMFGASTSWFEPGSSVFADGQPPGFVHSIEWRTATPVDVRKVNVFAAGDGEVYLHEREFDRLVLKAKSPGSEEFDVVLIDYVPTHPYSFLAIETSLLISLEVTPITAQDFRAEVVQWDAGRGYDGPRIIELDAFGTACYTPPDLVAWWPGEGDGEDVAGGNDGEMVNGLGFGEGLVGQAFEFNADGQYLLIPPTEDLAVGSLTMEAWIKPSNVDLDMPVVEYAPTPPHLGVGVHLWISVDPEGYQSLPGSVFANVISADGDNHIISTAGGIVQAGVWSHVALNYDMTSGLARLFHNGTQVAEEQLGSFLPRTALPVLLGHRTAVNAGNFNGFTFAGQMDEVSIYSRALSTGEIEAIYSAGSNGKCLPIRPCTPPPSGMLAWWPGEGHGEDVAGGNEGELMNGVGLGAGVVGQTLVFDGIDDHVRIPFSESLTSEAFSVEAWIRPLGPVIDPQWNQDFVFGQALGSPWVVVRPGTGGVRPVFGFFVDPFLYPEVESSVELPLDEFSHVAGTWDGTGLRIYVNGVLAGESFPSQAPVHSTCDFYIGGHLGNCAGYDFDGGYFHGAVDELSLYGRALSDSEIAAIHAAGSNGKCVPQGYTLRVGTTPGGTVLRNPELPGYQPGDTVTLTALPDVGFVFDHWEGDVSGTDPEVTLVMDGPRQVMAIFLDVAPPAIEIQSPTPGTTEHSTFILSGTVTDNLGVGSAMWEWNGQSLGFLPLNDGQFYVDGLQWALGENRIRVVAVDIAGNEASTEIVVEWAPVRLLSVLDPFPRQEGQRIQVTIQLASSGDVGGASFVLRYNPAYLKQPDLDWSQSVRSALNQVNTDIPGEVRATFALPATAVPAGTRNLAVVTFRARSVPETLTTPLLLQLLDVSDSNGNSMASGSAVRSGQATILVRRVVGDNNANHRLDVGDATLIQRLLTGIDPVRFWDRTGNDVNENTLLDSGDVIRVLRAVVGLDPQPLPSLDGVGSADISLARQSLVPMSDETAGAIALEADSLRAAPGELVTVRVRFAGVLSPVAAVALNLEYPVEALRLLNPQSHRVGEVVPATAVAIWNVAPAQNDYTLQSGTVSLAMSSALAWPSSDGVVAEFIFQVQEGQAGWHRWPIRVSQAEISADGYDMAALADATVYFVGRDPVPPQLTPASVGLGEGGFGFSFQGEFGVEYIVEVSSNLTEWVSLGTRTGTNEPITISDPAASGAEYRFYRVRFE